MRIQRKGSIENLEVRRVLTAFSSVLLTDVTADAGPEGAAVFSNFLPAGDDRLLFNVQPSAGEGREVWVTDGTIAGTEELGEGTLRTQNRNPTAIVNAHGLSLFQVGGTNGNTSVGAAGFGPQMERPAERLILGRIRHWFNSHSRPAPGRLPSMITLRRSVPANSRWLAFA